jgi:ferrochelatase
VVARAAHDVRCDVARADQGHASAGSTTLRHGLGRETHDRDRHARELGLRAYLLPYLEGVLEERAEEAPDEPDTIAPREGRAHLGQDLAFAEHERVERGRDAEEVPRGVAAGVEVHPQPQRVACGETEQVRGELEIRRRRKVPRLAREDDLDAVAGLEQHGLARAELVGEVAQHSVAPLGVRAAETLEAAEVRLLQRQADDADPFHGRSLGTHCHARVTRARSGYALGPRVPRSIEPETGILLVNVGSPSAPTAEAVRAYLAEFLGDPAVVRLPRWLWLPLLHGVILPRRAPRSAALYRSVWTEQGSPLVAITRAQRDALAAFLGSSGGPVARVACAMRYGEPSIASALDELAGCRELVLVPLFPQWSATTSGTVETAVKAELARRRDARPLRVSGAFFEDAGYVEALATRVRETVGEAGADHYLFSFHGLPARYVAAGDPYQRQCAATAAALARALALSRERWTLAYQSRFGRERWLAPDVAEVVPALAPARKRVLVCAPSFTTDCLETLEELGLRLRESLTARGGELVLVPCLNDDAAWVSAAARIVRRTLAG